MFDDTPPAPVVYITDLNSADYDPADLFDLAYLLRSKDHDVRGVCLTSPGTDGEFPLIALFAACQKSATILRGGDALQAALASESEAINLIVVGGYAAVAEILRENRALFRDKVARLFLIGGQVNDYAQGRAGERLPIDPRLKERNPERFTATGDVRMRGEGTEFAALLTSGEGVIWLPRDLCLWRFSAPGMLAEGGAVADFLLMSLQRANLPETDEDEEAAEDASAPVLLSALPALLLAVRPDPFVWMRLFRAIAIRLETNEAGKVVSVVTQTDYPNLYAVIAIDSAALSRFLAAALRDRSLSALPASG